jgi:hypothetical protein
MARPGGRAVRRVYGVADTPTLYSSTGRRNCSPDYGSRKVSGRVDEVTQAVGVEGKGDDIIYRYSIAASLTDLGGREKVQSGLEQQLRNSACKTKDAQALLRAGYTIQARYAFKGSPEEIQISLPPRACGY